MHDLAVALLIWVGVAGVWDILDPDALQIKIESGFRALAAVTGGFATLVLLCLVAGISTPWIVTICVGWFALAAIKAVVEL